METPKVEWLRIGGMAPEHSATVEGVMVSIGSDATGHPTWLASVQPEGWNL